MRDDYIWLAGVLEHRGSFVVLNQPPVPRFTFSTTSYTVALRVRDILPGDLVVQERGAPKGGWAQQESFIVALQRQSGPKWFETNIIPHMTQPRRAEIQAWINEWEKQHG